MILTLGMNNLERRTQIVFCRVKCNAVMVYLIFFRDKLQWGEGFSVYPHINIHTNCTSLWSDKVGSICWCINNILLLILCEMCVNNA